MKRLVVKQVDQPTHRCEVREQDGELDTVVFRGGRVACKEFADGRHRATGVAVYNTKRGGTVVLVRAENSPPGS